MIKPLTHLETLVLQMSKRKVLHYVKAVTHLKTLGLHMSKRKVLHC